MDKIDKLTPEQEAMLPVYVKKWIGIGTNTDRLDYNNTVEIIKGFRELLNDDVNVPLLIVDDPLEAWVGCCLLEHGVKFEDLVGEIKKVFNGNPEKYEIPPASLPWQSGSFFASPFAFYEYMLRELKLEIEPELRAKYDKWERTCELGVICPMKTATIVSQKPTSVCLNEQNVLHKDGGPALTYDGLGEIKIYALNGVTVPDWLAITPSHEIPLEKYKQLDNPDVKSEFVRKVGIERFLDQGKVLDTYESYPADKFKWWHLSQYKVVDMAFLYPNLTSAPYLHMVNQTTGAFHVEGVSPECTTIEKALEERFGGEFEIELIK